MLKPKKSLLVYVTYPSIKHEFEHVERQRQEISDNRMSLAQDQVNFPKDRSRDKQKAIDYQKTLLYFKAQATNEGQTGKQLRRHAIKSQKDISFYQRRSEQTE